MVARSDDGHVGEAGDVVQEGEADDTGRPVALFGDVDLGEAPVFAVGVVQLVHKAASARRPEQGVGSGGGR